MRSKLMPVRRRPFSIKLGNQGFAISGTLYILLLLFVLILTTMLVNLKMQKTETSVVYNQVKSKLESYPEVAINTSLSTEYKTLSRGKYQFKINDSIICYSYLGKDNVLNIINNKLVSNNKEINLIGENCYNEDINKVDIINVFVNSKSSEQLNLAG